MSMPSTSLYYGEVEAHPHRQFFASFNSLQKDKVLPELESTFTDNVIRIEPGRIQDNVHVVFGLRKNFTVEDMAKAIEMKYISAIHYCLSQFTWNPDEVEDPEFHRTVAETIMSATRNVNRLVEFIEINKKVLDCRNTRYLHVRVEAVSNVCDKKWNLFAKIIKNMIGDAILKQSEDNDLRWNVNGEGQLQEVNGSLTIVVHVTKCSAYVGLEIMGWNHFTVNMSHYSTGRYGVKHEPMIDRAGIREGMIVLDLNAICGEMIMEIVKRLGYRCHCIGLFDKIYDSVRAKNNLRRFLNDNNKTSKDVLVDFIAAEMKEFINFSAVDRLLATYPHKIGVSQEVVDEYFNRLVSVLSRCRPFTWLLLQCPYHPTNHQIQEAFERIVKPKTWIIIRFEIVMEEFHKKTVLILLERHIVAFV